MIVIMEPEANEDDIAAAVARLTGAGYLVQRSGTARVALGVTGNGTEPDPTLLAGLSGIASTNPTDSDYHLVSRHFQPEDSLIDAGLGAVFGGRELIAIAGPCSVEDGASLERIAAAVAAAGARGLRAGAFKPRSSPYSFQGFGEEGLVLLREAADAHGLLAVSEVLEPALIPIVAHYCDIVQVGARNMHNYPLLRELGRCRRTVLLKRGLAATLDEWLSAAEYIAACGNPNVILCERGIRTFETATRNTLDLSAVPVMKSRTHLPIVVDPSHGTGRREHVLPMARAAVAAGADGLLVEVHVDPDCALSDGHQTISTGQFERLMHEVRRVATAVDREVFRPAQSTPT